LPQRIHIVGIGGAGLSGSARILAQAGHLVTGVDRAESSFLGGLRSLGVELHVGEEGRAPLAADVELVVRSAAVPESDPDCAEALRRGIPVWKYARLLRELTPHRRTLAVAGTHGKTSVSWLLAYALRGLQHALGETAPRRGFLIGGSCQSLGVNSAMPETGGWFALEACEYDRSFLQFSSTGAIVINVEEDHLDYYGDLDAIEQSFARFCDRVDPDGLLVVGRDVPERVTNASRARVWRLGRELDVLVLGEDRGRFLIQVRGPGWSTPTFKLAVVGEFQIDNAALAIGLAVGRAAHEWRLDPAQAAKEAARSIERFCGAVRRFESWGTFGEIEVVHDYAHHPTEVNVTLEAARRAFPNCPIHVLFQPHQHSRTARFLPEFVESLRGVDHCVISDVYGARVHIDELGAGADELAIRLRRAGGVALAGGDLAQSLELTLKHLPEKSALLVLGAGDIDSIRDDLTRELALRSALQSGAGA
jgi:UDP-N-acetylmuramate--alanine ligase